MAVDIISVVIVLSVVLGSMILHELAHGLVALWLGDDTAKEAGRLSLNPLRHLDPIMSVLVPVLLYMAGGPVFGGAKPVPVETRNLKFREWGMALVAIAGPLTNFLIALVAFLVGHFTGALYNHGYLGLLMGELVVANLGFMIFNLIPIPPLDGSRVLFALAPDVVREVMMRVEQMGVVVIYLLILIFGSAFSTLMANGVNGMIGFFYFLFGR